jgi:hypothetical protein
LLASTGIAAQQQVIEFISRLFDIILSDETLHAPIRGLLARLQAPALRIALKDNKLLDDHSHPVWLLMAKLASTSTSYPRPGDWRFVKLLDFSEQLISQIVSHQKQDANLFRTCLSQLDAFLNDQLTIEALTRTEHIAMMQAQLSSRLLEQMQPLKVSASMRAFVAGPWAQVLAHARVQLGEKDEKSMGYLTAVDDLLWSLQVPNHPQSRQRLVGIIPKLLQRLRSGMALIELSEHEQEIMLHELMQAHTAALRPKAQEEPEAQDSTQAIMQRLREESSPEHGKGAHSFADSLIDLSSLETVPAELMEPQAQPSSTSKKENAVEPPHQWLVRMRAGQRYCIFLNGHWSHVQLLWQSERNQYFLFAGERPERNHSITKRALERLCEADLLKPVDAHGLIQQTVKAMFAGQS